MGDAARAGQPDPLADLAQARWVAAAVDRVADHLEHPALPDGQDRRPGLLRDPARASRGRRPSSPLLRRTCLGDRCHRSVSAGGAAAWSRSHRCRSGGLSAPGAALLTCPQTTALERQYQTPVRGVSSVRRTSVLIMASTSVRTQVRPLPGRPDRDPRGGPYERSARSRPRASSPSARWCRRARGCGSSRPVPTSRRTPASVRLNRRGRLVRTVGAVALAGALGWTVTSAVAAGASAPAHTVTVEAGPDPVVDRGPRAARPSGPRRRRPAPARQRPELQRRPRRPGPPDSRRRLRRTASPLARAAVAAEQTAPGLDPLAADLEKRRTPPTPPVGGVRRVGTCGPVDNGRL